jgi:hypothetical protein
MPYNPSWNAAGKFIIDALQASVLTEDPIEEIIERTEKSLQTILF